MGYGNPWCIESSCQSAAPCPQHIHKRKQGWKIGCSFHSCLRDLKRLAQDLTLTSRAWNSCRSWLFVVIILFCFSVMLRKFDHIVSNGKLFVMSEKSLNPPWSLSTSYILPLALTWSNPSSRIFQQCMLPHAHCAISHTSRAFASHALLLGMTTQHHQCPQAA